MKTNVRICPCGFAVPIWFLAVPFAFAQPTAMSQESESAEGLLEEVVVSARKRAESAQDVPITINVFSGANLRERGINDIESIEENTPGFTFDFLGGTRARPTIRGIGSDETGPGGDPSTGVFLDGVYLGRSGMQAVDAYDLERVEVLKGPQGTLFGRNVVGGAVSFVTAKPTDRQNARLSLTVGQFDTVETEGFVNVPVSDTVKVRAAFATKDNSGYGNNEFTEERLDDRNRSSARIHVLFEPAETMSFLLTADSTQDNANGRVGNTHRPVGSDADGPFVNRAEIDGFSERDTWGVSLTSEIDLDAFTLTNITAYRTITEGFLEDIDGFNRIENPGVVNVDLGFSDDADSFSTEFRLAGSNERLDWTVGTYYSQEEGDGTVTLRIDGTGAENTAEAFDTDLFFTGVGKTESVALFADMIYSLSDRWNLSGGARYTQDTKDFTGGFFALGGAAEVRTESISDVDFDETTWRVSLDYTISDSAIAYFSASTGFKSGAFPLIATVPGQFITPLAPETAENFEVGIKADLANDRVRLNASLFTQDFENLQIISVSSAGGNDSINAPTADIDGVEIDLLAFLTPNLSVEARYTYLDAFYGPFNFGGTILTNSQVIRTPKSDFALSLRYEHEFGDGSRFYLVPQVSGRDEVFDDVDNNLEELRPSRTIVNANVGWISADGTYELRVFGKNLTDENYFNRVSNIPGTAGQSTSGPPRMYGLQLVWNID
ncbi:MAG: TonB-dependent receptor [Pseudomonadota bacterium]